MAATSFLTIEILVPKRVFYSPDVLIGKKLHWIKLWKKCALPILEKKLAERNSRWTE
jgi:hypothetical protein